MPRKNVNKGIKKVHTAELKKAALKALETKTIRQVSKDFNVAKSTLSDWKKKPTAKLGTGKCTVLSHEEENLLVDALEYTAE